jgi:16S rRNA (guanine1516-N2)-methyltransferase
MKIAVSTDSRDPCRDQAARLLAAQLQLPYCDRLADAHARYAFVLVLDAAGLSLQVAQKPGPGPLQVDFVTGSQAWRRRHGGGKSQLIARALGLHKGARPEVLDATAGLGGDSYVLASLGCRVLMLEQSALVAALLEDGLRRLAAADDPQLQAIAGRMQLLPATRAQDYLAAAQSHDVIYLDPMFADAAGAAAVKKDMQILRQLLKPTGDVADLLAAALERARYRVVVKRHSKSASIAGPAPSYQLTARSTRFDIYSLQKYY